MNRDPWVNMFWWMVVCADVWNMIALAYSPGLQTVCFLKSSSSIACWFGKHFRWVPVFLTIYSAFVFICKRRLLCFCFMHSTEHVFSLTLVLPIGARCRTLISTKALTRRVCMWCMCACVQCVCVFSLCSAAIALWAVERNPSSLRGQKA